MGAFDLNTKLTLQDGGLIVQNTQDCTAIAEFAKLQHNAGFHGSNEMRHAAKIPSVIIEAYCNDHGVLYSEVMSDPIHFKRICNDPKNKAFRIWPGRV